MTFSICAGADQFVELPKLGVYDCGATSPCSPPPLASPGMDPALLNQYREDGYFVVRDLLGLDEVEAICQQITRVVNQHPAVPEELIQMEPAVASGEKTTESLELGVRKLFRVAKHNAFFRQLASHESLVAIARELIGPDILLIQSMTLMKPPGVSVEKIWHQDNAYFRVDPPDLFGLWIACDEATVENGCMHVMPGSHLGGIVEHAGPGDLYGATTIPQVEEVVAIPLSPGDALVFHGELLHFTPPNQTASRRRAVQYHYVSGTVTRRGNGNPFDYDPEAVIAGRNEIKRI